MSHHRVKRNVPFLAGHTVGTKCEIEFCDADADDMIRGILFELSSFLQLPRSV